MRYSVDLSPEMGKAVLARLQTLVTLPERGFVAGQAVASALDDLYGPGGGVYNDVDIFIRGPRFTQSPDRLVLLPQRFATRVSACPAPGTEYNHLTLQHTLVAAPTYTVTGTRRTDLLNEVFYETRTVLGIHGAARSVLASFDINAVRVGVDIETGHLIWNRAFSWFARTNEMRLCALHTPYHSLVRLFRKHGELEGVTVNVEASASLVAGLSTPEMLQAIQRNKAATFWFGAKYAEQARAVQGVLKPYFTLRSESRYYDEVSQKARKGFGDETQAPYVLSTLRRRGDPDAACQAGPDAGVLNMLLLPIQVYSHFSARSRSAVVVPAAPWQKVALALPPLAAQQERFGPEYLAGLPSASAAKELAKLLKPTLYLANALQGLSAVEQLTLVQDVRQQLQLANIPDVDHVLNQGAYASEAVDRAAWGQGCADVLAQERARRLGKLAVPTELDPALWQEWPAAQATVFQSERHAREWCAAQALESPYFMGSYFWIGVHLGRHARDTSLLRFEIDERTGLLDGYVELHLQTRMPRALHAAHRRMLANVRNFGRGQGWFRV